MNAIINWLKGSVWETLAGRGRGEEEVINLRSESKDTSEKAAKDRRHLAKGKVIDTSDFVALKEEGERLDGKEEKGRKLQKKRKKLLLPVLLLHPALQKHAKKSALV